MVLQTGLLNTRHMGDRIGVLGFAVVGADLAGSITVYAATGAPTLTTKSDTKIKPSALYAARHHAIYLCSAAVTPPPPFLAKSKRGRVACSPHAPGPTRLHARDMLDERGSGKGGAG